MVPVQARGPVENEDWEYVMKGRHELPVIKYPYVKDQKYCCYNNNNLITDALKEIEYPDVTTESDIRSQQQRCKQACANDAGCGMAWYNHQKGFIRDK